jgi:hypothetical protein
VTESRPPDGEFMPTMTEAEYATVDAMLAGLANIMRSLTARVDALAATASARCTPVPALPRARSAA